MTTAATTRSQDSVGVYKPKTSPITVFEPVNVRQAAQQEALEPSSLAAVSEIRAIDAPKGSPPAKDPSPILAAGAREAAAAAGDTVAAPLPSAIGSSPAPSKTFKGEFLSGLTIPPDTMGAVGDNHVVTATNDRMRIQTRDGVEISRMTLNAFFAGVVLEGGATASTFDPKIYYDRFNDRYILTVVANAQSLSSATLLAVSQTSDPTGMWNRYAIDADPVATAAGGKWADYPSVGFNKNWITVQINFFGFGTTGGGYQGPIIYVFDKQAAYNNTLSTVSAFTDSVANCTAPFEGKLGCGFTMVPGVVEDNTTELDYLVEDWDSQFGQLRLSKLTGTASAPILTVGTQFPQSPNSWRFNAVRIDGTSGGYMPQRQQLAFLPSGTRIMANDSRIQNAVLRNGSLWTVHHVMVAATPTAAGLAVGGVANPDIRTAIQWWEIDPTIETGLPTPPIQRARIEDPLADNCHNGSGVSRAGCAAANQLGQFFSFPNIAVNQSEDVLIGFSVMSPLTYPNAGYALRRASDPANTMRDYVIFRPGQANYNIGAGTGTARQNRWGDYSASQTDPLNDTDFWTTQEYAGAVRDFGIGRAGNWETWWALVSPTGPTPVNSTSGLIVSEVRLIGPQGVRDEFFELYNPSNTPIRVTTTDNSDGWAAGFDTGVLTTTTQPLAVIPFGTVVPARGHFLVTNNQDAAAAGAPNLVYSLNGYPGSPGRTADSDAGYSLDIPDNQGVALFNTATRAAFALATRLDAAGFVSAPALYKEGAGIPNITGTPTGQISFHRSQSSGTPQDTGSNAADFIFTNTLAPTEALGSSPRLGAPGPENLDSPIRLLPSAMGIADSSPGAVRDNSDTGTNKTFGTLSLRSTLTNNTGSNITTLRLRAVDITTFPAPAGTADLRLLTSGDAGALKGTTLQEPPTQPNGGGWNSSAALGTVALATPLATGASINLQLLLGVQQTGTFNFCVTIETLPAAGSNVICFSGDTETVPPPTPNIVPAGTSVVSESCPPANGVVDPGERVTLNFTLMNNGGVATTNLVATMQSSANVIAPSGPQNYGAIPPGGSATRPFTFTADGAPGSTIPVMLQLQDGATNLGTVTFNITLGTNTSCRIPRLIVSSTLTRDDATTVRATYTVQNIGAVTATNVMLTTAMLGSTNTTTPLPQLLGNLAPGQTSAPMVVFFTNSTPGASSTLKLGGTYTGGTFSSTKRVTIP